jgi:hypothetical protein
MMCPEKNASSNSIVVRVALNCDNDKYDNNNFIHVIETYQKYSGACFVASPLYVQSLGQLPVLSPCISRYIS